MATTKVTTDVTELNSDTTPLAWAKGTTAERPTGTISYGFLRENTTTNKMEVWTDHSGTDEFKSLNDTAPTITVNYLVVAGGGGGGGNGNAGGGGAGGYRTSIGSGNTTIDIELGAATSLIVGAGGAGSNYPTTNPQGVNGGSSRLSTIISTGGGGGNGSGGPSTTASGGSGGGGNYYNVAGGTGNAGGFTPVEGFAGGNGGGAYNYSGGGGGGATEVGNVPNSSVNDGGDGAVSTIISNTLAGTYTVGQVVGANVYFAGGGGGGNYYQYTRYGGLGGGTNGATTLPSPSACPSDAANNTGGGGGGGATDVQCGGDGGSGVVIIKTTGVASATFSAGCTVNGTAGAQTTNGDTSTGNSIFVVTVAGASDTVTFN